MLRDSIEVIAASLSPEALDYLTPEQRHHLYKMPRLRLAANEDGTAALDADALPVLKSSNLDTLCLRSTRIR